MTRNKPRSVVRSPATRESTVLSAVNVAKWLATSGVEYAEGMGRTILARAIREGGPAPFESTSYFVCRQMVGTAVAESFFQRNGDRNVGRAREQAVAWLRHEEAELRKRFAESSSPAKKSAEVAA